MTPASTQSVALAVGCAQKSTRKAEDVYVVRTHAAPAMRFAAAVFDGHGGRAAADACKEGVVGKLMRSSTPLDLDTAANAFWDTDAELGLSGVWSGSTATVLLAEQEETEGALRCALLWVGDSCGVRVDMLAVKGQSALLAVTPPHLPGNAAEASRLALEWAVRQRVHASWAWDILEMSSLNSEWSTLGWAEAFGDQGRAIAPAARASRRLRSAARRVMLARKAVLSARDGEAPSAEEVALFVRALNREAKLNARTQAFHACGHKRRSNGGEASEPFKRGTSFVAPRLGSGPMVVQAKLTGGNLTSGSNPLADVMMTRSIGDWDAARACVPQPEAQRFEVQPGQHQRVIVASDGCWDFVKADEAAMLVRRARSAQEAATKLTSLASKRSHAQLGRLKDDTTVIVVDIDFTPRSQSPPARNAPGLARLSRRLLQLARAKAAPQC